MYGSMYVRIDGLMDRWIGGYMDSWKDGLNGAGKKRTAPKKVSARINFSS